MKATLRTATVVVAFSVLGGCGSLIDEFYGLDEAPTVDEAIAKCVGKYVGGEEKEKIDERKNIHDFLDCFFDPENNNKNARVGEENLPLRLLRAHAIVGALAVYGAYSMKYDRLANRENAAVLLGAIENAEAKLWSAKTIGDNPPHGYVAQAYIDYFDRIRLVYKVAEAAARPGIIRTRNIVRRIILAAGSQNPLAVVSTVKDSRRAIARALTARRYSAAFIAGIGGLIAEINTKRSGTPSIDDWKTIDNFYLKAACETLADIAEVPAHRCVPSRS